MNHILACQGHFWCSSSDGVNLWVIPLTLATIIGFIIACLVIARWKGDL